MLNINSLNNLTKTIRAKDIKIGEKFLYNFGEPLNHNDLKSQTFIRVSPPPEGSDSIVNGIYSIYMGDKLSRTYLLPDNLKVFVDSFREEDEIA